MKNFLFALLLISFFSVGDQSNVSVKNPADKAKPGAIPPPDTTRKAVWVPFLVAGVGINQIAFSTWVKGGDNSVSCTFLCDFHYDRTGKGNS